MNCFNEMASMLVVAGKVWLCLRSSSFFFQFLCKCLWQGEKELKQIWSFALIEIQFLFFCSQITVIINLWDIASAIS